jgi:hypothetical protein
VKRFESPDGVRELDKYDLYTLCAQAPARQVAFLRGVHGRSPRVLREDFSGPAALCAEWVKSAGSEAVAVDRDPEPLAKIEGVPGVRRVVADVVDAPDRADLVVSTNYAVCEIHERARLVEYLKLTRDRLNPGGVFVADLYGGPDALTPGQFEHAVRGPGGERIVYVWEQIEASPLTARVRNAMHFQVKTRGSKPRTLENAFEYDWRLWTVPELADALSEAGFASVEVYDRLGDAMDADGNVYVKPVQDGVPSEVSFVVYVVGRAG